MIDGTITEHRNGTTTEYRAGDILEGTRGAKHWIENKGTAQATFLVMDIVKKSGGRISANLESFRMPVES